LGAALRHPVLATELLQYMVGAPFYRVDYLNASQSFVTQFGYRGDAADACWDQNLTSNATWSVEPPGNVRGMVSFSMDAVDQTNSNPNCTSTSYCAQGFSTNIFINYANNSFLDAPGFSPFGYVSAQDMEVVDGLNHSYGECSDLCSEGATDPYCVGTGSSCQGLSMESLVSAGAAYWKPNFPKMDFVASVSVSQTA